MVEALAVKRAILFALEIGTIDVEIEGGSKTIIKAWRPQQCPMDMPLISGGFRKFFQSVQYKIYSRCA